MTPDTKPAECPAPAIQEFKSHLMKLVASSHDVETWKCVGCGHIERRFSPYYRPQKVHS